MIKNAIIALSILSLFAVGIGFVILKDPERITHNVIEDAISQVANKTSVLESSFLNSQSLPESGFSRSLDYQDSNNQLRKLALQVKIGQQAITLQFGDGDLPIANQSFILKPVIKDQKVIWQCLDGSVLLRFRPKPCRLGSGIQLSEYE